MNEKDLENAKGLYHKRRHIANHIRYLESAKTLGVKSLSMSFYLAKKLPSGGEYGNADFDATDGYAIVALALKLALERLADLDAALRAYGCEPPKKDHETQALS